MAIEASLALATRSDCSSDNALSHLVTRHGHAESRDRSDWLVTHDQARRDRIFSLEDVYVGAANGGRRDAEQCVSRADLRYWPLLKLDPSRRDEDRRSHGRRRARGASALVIENEAACAALDPGSGRDYRSLPVHQKLLRISVAHGLARAKPASVTFVVISMDQRGQRALAAS
jgi:hypothetical protein